MSEKFVAAVVQDCAVVFDREATLDKVRRLTEEAGKLGARVIVFPEAFVSGYPKGLDFGARIGSRRSDGRDDFRRYFESAIDVPGPDCDAIGAAAKRVRLVAGDMAELSVRGRFGTVLAPFRSFHHLYTVERQLATLAGVRRKLRPPGAVWVYELTDWGLELEPLIRDFGRWAAVPFAELLEDIIELVREDAEALGCRAELEHAREILARGTSAVTQRHVYNAALAAGADHTEALKAVVDWLIEETVRDV